MHESLVAQGAEVRVGKPAVAISRNSHTVTVRLESGEELVAEELLAAVGRRPATRFPTRSEVWLRLLETYERSQR